MSNNLLQTHGDVKPVFAIDQTNGSGVTAVGIPVQIAGPKLDFFKIDLKADPSAKLGVNSAVDSVIKTATQLATVHMYQVNSSGIMSIALYPAAAWTAADLEVAVRALGTVDSFALAAVDVTSGGFTLA